VSAATHWSYFGGFYQNAKNYLPVFAVDAATQFSVYPKIRIPREQIDAMIHTRTGAIISRELAAKYGWKIGDRIPLQSSIWTRKDGTDSYPVDVVGIMDISAYNLGSFPGFFINYDYLNDERTFGHDYVFNYIVKINDPRRGVEIANAIDAIFANSSAETETQTEQAFAQSQLKQVGDINLLANSIVGAALFALLFLTGNTMMQSVRERVPELAVLKTLGFSNGKIFALVVVESLALCVVAALLGLFLARIGFLFIGAIFGFLSMPLIVVAAGLALATGLAIVSGIPPAWRTSRINVVDALADR
jgi:putative ABC transport system permease protein